MTLQDPRRLRRRSRLRIGDIRFTVLGILIAAIPALATVAHAARPLFPNMAHTVGERPIMVATADLDGDGIRDLVVANRWSEDLSILRGLGGGDFGAQQRVPVGAIPVALAIADFNGDGRDDVAAALPVDDKVAVFLTPPSGVPAAPFLLSAGDSPGSVLAVDLDLDGRTDLLAANYFGGVSLWKGLGNGSFQSEKRLASGVSAYSLVVALVNGDLVPDLVVASPGSRQAVVLLGDASGGFGDPAGYSTDALDSVGLPRQIVAADVDLDGAVDFLVGTFDNSEEQNYLVLLRGRGDGSLEPGVLLSRNADGDFSLGAADFNNDGRPDLAFGAHHGFNCCELRNGGIWLGRGD
ncbi:MAG TPA: VCBS repeat-containing protein, partial [Dongiaceae bacterium]|nr:VCBS repeat-containing protein [Dongiaceae bacterium]